MRSFVVYPAGQALVGLRLVSCGISACRLTLGMVFLGAMMVPYLPLFFVGRPHQHETPMEVQERVTAAALLVQEAEACV